MYTSPVYLNGYMKLGDSTYYDENGQLVEPEHPEGFKRADHILWNTTKDELELMVRGLPEGKRFRVMVQEVDA